MGADLTAKDRAEKSARALWKNDAASKWIGMKITSVDEGSAVAELLVEAHHCNGLGICHGGITFALADTAFAFACNSRNQATVAQHNSISYVAPGRLGDTLIATASETSTTGRSGIYDVAVNTADGRAIAQFRGLCRTVKGQLFVE